ncbi:NepR family anti-sigma factor [Aurantiacibacter sp. MUD61]|uniref:NepR family anti-sigma factor n=1 Tax=Aurantiacibacter sp. MUD61 TaxID=3009083 RepID=UPI0022F07BB8|nr:NepR family anti-sigma factor [Aurantiacibacter sp. MUD61]
MTPPKDEKKLASSSEKPDASKQMGPEWTSGLKRFYDSVLDEPLPDSFKDLLSKLDENDGE